MDQKFILTRARLRLTGDIEASKPEHGLLILKHIALKTYLVVDENQWRLLQNFREAQPLQELLPRLINERRTPPLRELYELVLKAVYSGMLLVNGQPAADAAKKKQPVEWEQSLSIPFAQCFGVAAILFGFAGLALFPIQTPDRLVEIAVGWLLICAAISGGNFLAACILTGLDREVFDARFRWFHPFPHIYCNLEDARMAGRTGETPAALMQLAPMFFLIGVASLWYRELVYILLFGVFYLTLPTGLSAASRLLRSVYRRYPLSTTRDFLFVQNQLLWTLINTRIKYADKRYLLIFSVFTITWLGSVLMVNLRAFDLNLDGLTALYVASGASRLTAIIVFGMMAAVVFGAAWFLLWIAAMNLVTVVEHAVARRRPGVKLRPGREPSDEEVVAFFQETLLLKGMPEELLQQLAGRVHSVIAQPRQYVFREGDPGDHLYFVVSGAVSVLMDLRSGRRMKITELGPGDVFGEIALLHHVPRTRSIRATRKTFLLALKPEDFRDLIVSNIGAQEVESIIEKQSFLHRIDLCRHWHPQAMVSFAKMAHLAEFEAGELVIKTGLRNQFFYLIYDGLLEVLAGGKRVAKLSTGEFFGEISLLQNSTATADIVALTDTRCLVVQRRDFLEFLAKDFFVGLQFEEISSKRLKHPIFPLTGVAYDDFPERY